MLNEIYFTSFEQTGNNRLDVNFGFCSVEVNTNNETIVMLKRIKDIKPFYDETIEFTLHTKLIMSKEGGTPTLFGFYTKDELTYFNRLILVQGIGTKLAIQIMDYATKKEFEYLVSAKLAEELCKLKGIGIQTSKKIVRSYKLKGDL